jgi:hypothetical protein
MRINKPEPSHDDENKNPFDHDHVFIGEEEIPAKLMELRNEIRRLTAEATGEDIEHVMSVVTFKSDSKYGSNVMFDIHNKGQQSISDLACLYATAISSLVGSLKIVAGKLNALPDDLLANISGCVKEQLDKGTSEVWSNIINEVSRPSPNSEFLKQESSLVQRGLIATQNGSPSWAADSEATIDASMARISEKYPDKKGLVAELRGKLVSVRQHSQPEVAASKIAKIFWGFKEDVGK